ncbi:MAG: NAD-dependent epimerase/dehydratase family protein [Parasporobacterium sp.]|nr:NAD-dependent epimerase/dehydratase family protein [Parasporobacterium sp.]
MKDKCLEEDLEIIAGNAQKYTELHHSTVLVTGSTGLVGSLTVKGLLTMNRIYNTDIKVLAMIRSREKAAKIFAGFTDSNLEFINGDLSNPVDIAVPVDFIVHTASPTSSKFFVEHPVETLETAIDGTRNILKFAVDKKCRGVVYLSSMEAFGNPGNAADRAKEDDLGYIDIHNVRSSYSEGKRICELLCSCFSHEYNVPVRIARLAQTFGAGISYEENRVFAQFAKSVINRTDIVLHTRGLSYGNYCYTRDVINALLLLLVRGEDGQAYTVANEASATTIFEMANMVAEKLAGNEIKVIFDIPEDSNTYGYAPDVQLRLDSSRMRSLGWTPEVSLEETYRRMISSMLSTK